MNVLKKLTALSLVLAAGATFAQEATPDTWMEASAAKSRAQVQTELQQARANGEMKVFRAGYIESVKQARSRADVVADLQHARASGELDRLNAEAASFAPESVSTGSVVARVR
jgi:hypothetical protein